MTLAQEPRIELSIIVPILNEVARLPVFLGDIRRQKQINCEIIFSDGGSTDGSLELLQKENRIRVVTGPPGRGRQLNQGLAAARGEWLLFLHVDSRFSDVQALRKGIDFLQRAGCNRVAGHFALVFERSEMSYPAAYDYYERKARTGRPETIHGDQGFLLHRRLQHLVGPFCEDLPVMEDTIFAERLRHFGQWQLLPAEICTSARRFEAEGLWQRQLLGALMMCFRSIGWHPFFTQATNVYRLQANTGQLQLSPFFELIAELLAELPLRRRLQLWLASGAYVRHHNWQFFFAIDCHRARYQGRPVAATPTKCLFWCEPIFNLCTDNPAGRGLVAVLLRFWFLLCRKWLLYNETKSAA